MGIADGSEISYFSKARYKAVSKNICTTSTLLFQNYPTSCFVVEKKRVLAFFLALILFFILPAKVI